ncbi:MAG TPA: hypothetical protein VE844_07420 [Gammaproteobacteria bacterium]|jgi:hypothetical protein|nr:hypothetical protein [Gammaproteobacteria bacterium]
METRQDPFLEDVSSFEVRKGGRGRLDPKAVEEAAQASGFEDRAPAKKKEKLKPLPFRLPESEVEKFHRQAYEEIGPGYGSLVTYFRKMWKAYEEREGR